MKQGNIDSARSVNNVRDNIHDNIMPDFDQLAALLHVLDDHHTQIFLKEPYPILAKFKDDEDLTRAAALAKRLKLLTPGEVCQVIQNWYRFQKGGP